MPRRTSPRPPASPSIARLRAPGPSAEAVLLVGAMSVLASACRCGGTSATSEVPAWSPDPPAPTTLALDPTRCDPGPRPPVEHVAMHGEPFDAPTTGACGGLAELARDHFVTVLDDRARIALAADASDTPPPFDVMGAPAPAETSRLVWLQAGPDDGPGAPRMAFEVEELFVTPGEDLVAYVAHRAPIGWRIEELPTAADADLPGVLRGVWSEPDALRDREGNVSLGEAFLVPPDGHVLYVRATTSPETARTGGCVSLARHVVASMRAGERALDTTGGERQLSSGVSATLSEGQVLSREEGPDFHVARIHAITAIDAPAAWLGIYFGGFPEFSPEGRHPTWATEMLDETFFWYEHCENGGRFVDTVDLTTGMHVFYGAEDDARFDEVRRTAESLRRIPRAQ